MTTTTDVPHRRAASAVALAALLTLTACAPTAPTASPTSAPPRATAAPSPTAPVPQTSSASPSPATRSSVTVTVRVHVERRTTDESTAGFEEQVLAILADQRGWTRAGFTFVADADAPHTIVLGEGDEVDRLCLPYDTFGQYSCQNGPVVALNADRWRTATPSWPGTLEEYRTMLVNHEVGHLLHLHHPSPQCPGEGLPAPVMLQQSTELGTCTPNPWPLPWEIDLAAARHEPLAPPAAHDVTDHRPTPPAQQQDLTHEPPPTG